LAKYAFSLNNVVKKYYFDLSGVGGGNDTQKHASTTTNHLGLFDWLLLFWNHKNVNNLVMKKP